MSVDAKLVMQARYLRSYNVGTAATMGTRYELSEVRIEATEWNRGSGLGRVSGERRPD
jgi:hypothetical protein